MNVAAVADLKTVLSHPTPPPPPATLEETGLHPDTLAQLLLKTLVGGEASGTALSEKLRLPYSVLEALIQHGRIEKLLEVRGTSGVGSAGYRYVLTDLGRDRAQQFFDLSRYVGPAPVPLAHYNTYVRACMAAKPYLNRDRLSGGFGNLVVSKGMFDQLGPAVNSGKSLFLYGAPGNGKTVLAEGIGRAYGDEMHMPFALDVDGQTITMYDPVSHQIVGSHGSTGDSVVTNAAYDRRWAHIMRPVVVVGGELTLEMLDLTFNPIARFYEAPIQVKANGGVFVVDDFGRQRIPARDLLNRWIVPLESRVDYLTLHTGRKFEVPFNVLVVFATNLKPESLADEAFLRRIPYKILAKNPTMDEVLPDLRAELQEARDPVRPGDGRVSGSQVLPAAQAADARVPSARPDRTGRRQMSVPKTGNRRSRASSSTPRARAISLRSPPHRATNDEVASSDLARRRPRRAARDGRRRARPRPRQTGSATGSREPADSATRPRGQRCACADRRPVLGHGGQNWRRLSRDRPADWAPPARQRSARRHVHRLSPRAGHRGPQPSRAGADRDVDARGAPGASLPGRASGA